MLLICCNFFKKKLFLLILPMFLFVQPVIAQSSGSIKGKVYDKNTGEELIGANIFIKASSLGAASDINGNYNIRNVPAGNQILVVSYIGYVTVTINVTIPENKVLLQDFSLEPQAVEGETVVITAQAEGQLSAINQQLSSNTIANVVSKARIEELPDVNAAESIGRLPGVSIERSGGEATKIEIRGLSPKYNTVTVNGVRVPATGGDDRSVDLSLISSNMLDGIVLKKAVTPDMDADVLGGSVDLRLKEAPEKFQLNASAQGGYNKLQDYYGNYNFTASLSDRFFDKKFGVIAGFNIDEYDRSADKLQGDYRQTTLAGTNVTSVIIQNLNLREENITRGRTGASLVLDYRIPDGKITANSFYNRLHWDGLYRINRMAVRDNRHYYDMEDRGGATSIFTGALGSEQDFGWLKYNVSVARTSSRINNPAEHVWTFDQENAAFRTSEIGPETPLDTLPKLATIDTLGTGLANIYVYDTKLDENETAFQLNLQMPFSFGSDITGYLKFGGKFRWLDRNYDQEQNGRDGIQYGGGTGVNTILTSTLKYLSDKYPNEWNWLNDSILVRSNGVLPITRVLSDYSRTDFLDGKYPLGLTYDQKLMEQMLEAIFATGENRNYSIGSIGRDYDGTERYQAGYIMSELNFTQYFTLIPGVRWEKDFSHYNGQRFREATIDNIQGPPADLEDLSIERENEFWLPMVHLIVNPFDWLKIRLARTETLTRPDFIQYAPITSINVFQNYIRAANSKLKPAKSTNYDASISVYENYIGLLTLSGFYKSIKDLIFQSSYVLARGIPVIEGLNIPNSWLIGAAPQVDTYVNNSNPAVYKGFEIEWQTHFWYLPSILHGLVLNVNYTKIFSELDKQIFLNKKGPVIPGSFPPQRSNLLIDTIRTARMPDQPSDIVNITIGYDYEGFSIRASYLYQTDKVTFVSSEPALDNFTGSYQRWDITLRQRLGYGLQIFANFNNINSEPDRSFRGESLISPSYIEYYGFTMDVGLRFNL